MVLLYIFLLFDKIVIVNKLTFCGVIKVLNVYICVGSSCHLKGSYQIIKKFQELIKENNLESEVVLKASFCLGNCTKGVSIKVEEEIIGGITPENVVEKFEEHILKKVW